MNKKNIVKAMIGLLLFGYLLQTISFAFNTKLYPGEKKVGNTIIGRPIMTPVKDLANKKILRSDNNSPNYYVVHETAQFYYEAFLQFQPCYRTSSNDEEYGMVSGRNVKNAVMDFQRAGRSVCNGPHRTRWGNSKFDCDIIYKRISANDSIIDWGESGTTYFWRRWFYFDN